MTRQAFGQQAIVVAEMKAICDEFEAYGYRRIDAELRHRGMVVNAKKIRRLSRAVIQASRFIATTCQVTIIRSSLTSRTT